MAGVKRDHMGLQKIIGVIGSGFADGKTLHTAETVGRIIAKRGALLVCGGLGGVMEAAARGAKTEGGTTIGILPHPEKESANPFIDIPVATGFGEGRNVIIVRTADALIAIGGEYGTLSEIAFALKMGKTVIGLDTWDIKGVVKAESGHTDKHNQCRASRYKDLYER
jgi:uncharacterized protein (TIGR00725 family)